jgi:tellurium resistance protein TerD
MSVNLQKGQKIDLTKGNSGLSGLTVGLGWDEVEQKSEGFISGLFGSKAAPIDCDASVIMLDANKKLSNLKNLVYYGNLKHKSGSVTHMGDNLTGEGDGDDEQIKVSLGKIPQDIYSLVFVVNIFDCAKRKQDFGLISNAFIRIVNSSTGEELAKFNLSENYAGKTALIAGEVYRHNNEWKFGAIGEGTNALSLTELARKYTT